MKRSESQATQKESLTRTTPTLAIAITAVMTGLVFVVTKFVFVPISAVPGQEFDAGDIMIFITAWTFGPRIGGFAGGVGSAISDSLNGGFYAPFTLVIKGTEGYLAGWIAQRQIWGLKTSWLLASTVMVGGYFVTNVLAIGLIFGATNSPGLAAGVLELPFDVLQVLIGGLIGLPVSRVLKKSLPPAFSQLLHKTTGI